MNFIIQTKYLKRESSKTVFRHFGCTVIVSNFNSIPSISLVGRVIVQINVVVVVMSKASSPCIKWKLVLAAVPYCFQTKGIASETWHWLNMNLYCLDYIKGLGWCILPISYRIFSFLDIQKEISKTWYRCTSHVAVNCPRVHKGCELAPLLRITLRDNRVRGSPAGDLIIFSPLQGL